MTNSYILEKVFRTRTGIKFETLFSSSDYFSRGETDAIFALSGKAPLEMLLLIESANGGEITSGDILTRLRGIFLFLYLYRRLYF